MLMPHARVTVAGGLDPVLRAYPHLVEVLVRHNEKRTKTRCA